jgi:maleylacetate reductase
MRFVHDNLPQRVCFGSGEAAAHLRNEIGNLGASKVMVIAGKGERTWPKRSPRISPSRSATTR